MYWSAWQSEDRLQKLLGATHHCMLLPPPSSFNWKSGFAFASSAICILEHKQLANIPPQQCGLQIPKKSFCWWVSGEQRLFWFPPTTLFQLQSSACYRGAGEGDAVGAMGPGWSSNCTWVIYSKNVALFSQLPHWGWVWSTLRVTGCFVWQRF